MPTINGYEQRSTGRTLPGAALVNPTRSKVKRSAVKSGLRGRSRAARPSPRVDRMRLAATSAQDGWPSSRLPRGHWVTEPGVQSDSSAIAAVAWGFPRGGAVLPSGGVLALTWGFPGVPGRLCTGCARGAWREPEHGTVLGQARTPPAECIWGSCRVAGLGRAARPAWWRSSAAQTMPCRRDEFQGLTDVWSECLSAGRVQPRTGTIDALPPLRRGGPPLESLGM